MRGEPPGKLPAAFLAKKEGGDAREENLNNGADGEGVDQEADFPCVRDQVPVPAKKTQFEKEETDTKRCCR